MKAYLVYRPVMNYEESEEAHFICSTQEKAEEAVQRIRDFCYRLIKELEPLTMRGRVEKLKVIKWPFDANYSCDIWSLIQFTPEHVGWRELPLDPEP